MNTVLQIKLDGIILKSNLPRLILDNSTSCASSLGTIDVNESPPSLVARKRSKYLSKHLKIDI